MSYFICSNCGSRHEIFDHGGVERTCQRMGTEVLGEIPLDGEIRIGGDKGIPVVVNQEDSPNAQAFSEIAKKIKAKITA